MKHLYLLTTAMFLVAAALFLWSAYITQISVCQILFVLACFCDVMAAYYSFQSWRNSR